MRLIDADAMKAHIMEFACDPCKKYGADRDGIRCPFCNTGNLLGEIDDAPTADAVQVVRCKECKYYLHSSEVCGIIDTRLHFYETDKRWSDGCFCSWGERKETEDERFD